MISPKNLSFEKQQHPPPSSGAADGFVHFCENSGIFYMFTGYVYHELIHLSGNKSMAAIKLAL